MEEKNKVNIWKVVAISAGVAVTVAAVIFTLYKLFKKYFRFNFECGDCNDCEKDCFYPDYYDKDIFDDEDFEPLCTFDDDGDILDADESEKDSETK